MTSPVPALAAGLLAGIALAAAPAPLEIGDRVAGRLFSSLMATLQEQLDSGGPEAAIAYCRLEALPLAARTAQEFPQVKNVRRTALRVRNPTNAPDAGDRSVLEKWLAGWDPAAPPRPVLKEFTATDGRTELRYYRPVAVTANCLACHGGENDIPAGVRAALRQDYPQDQATGFSEGDLRGAIVVTFQEPPAGAPKTD